MPALAHIGVGLASKRYASKNPVWALIIAAMLIDLPYFISEDLGPLWLTHSLPMAVVWAFVASMVTALIVGLRNSRKMQTDTEKAEIPIFHASTVIGLLVFSHWILDFIGWPMAVINPELSGIPLFFDDTQTVGLGVYSTWIGAITMDFGILVIGIVAYLLTRRKKKSSNAE